MGTEMENKPSWLRSVTGQFGVTLSGRVHAPVWFYLLMLGGWGLLFGQGPAWRTTGALVAFSALSPMVQETRRLHGAPLGGVGWWLMVQDLLLLAAALVLTVSGARAGWTNVTFAFGSCCAVVCTGFLLFHGVLLREERKRPETPKLQTDGNEAS